MFVEIKNSCTFVSSIPQKATTMRYYIRYTETPNADLERGVSYHLAEVEAEGYEWNDYFNSYAQQLSGLCAFELEAETLEEAIEEAAAFKVNSNFNSQNGDSYCILSGVHVDDCPEGVVVRSDKIVYIVKGEYFAE